MQITVNGQSRQVDEALSVAGLLAELSLPPQRVAVERNKLIVPRAQHADTTLTAGDELEIVTLVGGG